MYTILNKDFVYNNTAAVFFTNIKMFDSRGYFTVGFNKDAFKNEINQNFNIVQHNISSSKENIARGLHFQIENNQAKLVHCIEGSVIDIIVDMRINSPFFGNGKAYLLDSVNTFLYVPHGFAHGFITTNYTDRNNIFEYFVDDIWNKNSEYVLSFKDYMSNNNIYLTNTKNEIILLNDLEYCKLYKLNFSEKDIKISKKYLSNDIDLTEFKDLVKDNINFK